MKNIAAVPPVRQRRRLRIIVSGGPDVVQEHRHVVALQPHEHERLLVRNGLPDRETEHITIERGALRDVTNEEVGGDGSKGIGHGRKS